MKRDFEVMNQEELVLRPDRKPDTKTKGHLLKWDGSDYTVFQPVVPRETPARAVIREGKGLCYYHNQGDKESSYSLHVNVDGREQDPAAAILQKVQEGLRPLTKKVPQLPTARFIIDEDRIKVWYSKEHKQLRCWMNMDAQASVHQMSSALFSMVAEINKVITLNKFKK